MNEYGFVHRDIKPSNIIINRKGKIDTSTSGLHNKLRVKLIDFNLASEYQSNSSLSRIVAGTKGYLAPEICYLDAIPRHGHDFNHEKLDSFSIGIILYEMVYGFTPFR